MLWVVIGHSPLSLEDMPNYIKVLYDFAYSFHMPLFILISGYLFYLTRLQPRKGDVFKWTWSTIMKDKLIRLGIPYVVFTILALFVKSLFPNDMARPVAFNIKEFIFAIFYPGDGPLSELWFIAVLMWGFALSFLWRFALRKRWVACVILIALIVSHYLNSFCEINVHFLSIDNTLHYLIWFYLGILVCHYDCVSSLEKMSIWFIFIFPGIALYLVSDQYNLNDLETIFAILFSYGLVKLFDRYVPNFFGGFRDYTYQIYLIGIFAQIVVKMIWKRVDIPYFCGFMACLVIGLYVPVLISKIAQRTGWKPLLLSIGLK